MNSGQGMPELVVLIVLVLGLMLAITSYTIGQGGGVRDQGRKRHSDRNRKRMPTQERQSTFARQFRNAAASGAFLNASEASSV
jgi:hypothetical protein